MLTQLKKTILAGFLLASLTSCNDNPAWTGTDGSSPTEKLAKTACKCIYEVLDTQTDLDIRKLLKQAPIFTNASAGETVELNKVDEVVRALEMGEDLNLTIDNSSCMESIEDEMFNKGIGFEELMAAVDKDCQLGLFYN